jgi:hypothetical protein
MWRTRYTTISCRDQLTDIARDPAATILYNLATLIFSGLFRMVLDAVDFPGGSYSQLDDEFTDVSYVVVFCLC